MTFHGIGVLVLSAVIYGSFVGPYGTDVALAREDVRELTENSDTMTNFPDDANSQETGGSLGPAPPLHKLKSDAVPDSQDGGDLAQSLPSAGRDRSEGMTGAWKGTERSIRYKYRKTSQTRYRFLEDDDDGDCSSSSSSSESSEVPPGFFQRRRFQSPRRRNSWRRRRKDDRFGTGGHTHNRKKSRRCRKHWSRETTTSEMIITTSPTTGVATTLPTTRMTTTSPMMASESRTEAQFMTTSRPTREETTPATQPTTETESPTTVSVTPQSTTEKLKTVGVVEPK